MKAALLDEGLDFEDEQGEMVNGSLSLQNNVFQFMMNTEWRRCPCSSIPPCWYREEFKTRFIEKVDEGYWNIVLQVVKIDPKSRRRKRRKHKPEENVEIGNEIPFYI